MGRVIPVDPEDGTEPIQYRLTEAAHRALLVAMWEERIMARIEFKTALGAAEGVATRAGNYFRAVKNGGKHDPHEVHALLEDVEILLELVNQETAGKEG